ncbi:MAG TPA: hypothetical protein VN736_24600 [Candidatus Limnocylindrales bacterium]|nr:hypothetical protein [Candidatus Limnocylindrales bacterium]
MGRKPIRKRLLLSALVNFLLLLAITNSVAVCLVIALVSAIGGAMLSMILDAAAVAETRAGTALYERAGDHLVR